MTLNDTRDTNSLFLFILFSEIYKNKHLQDCVTFPKVKNTIEEERNSHRLFLAPSQNKKKNKLATAE